jgi:hypothetical protein
MKMRDIAIVCGNALIAAARDRCDYTIERIRVVVNRKYKYLRNHLTDRPCMQPSHKDPWPVSTRGREMMARGEMNACRRSSSATRSRPRSSTTSRTTPTRSQTSRPVPAGKRRNRIAKRPNILFILTDDQPVMRRQGKYPKNFDIAAPGRTHAAEGPTPPLLLTNTSHPYGELWTYVGVP